MTFPIHRDPTCWCALVPTREWGGGRFAGWPVGRQRRWENCFSIAEVISINVELHLNSIKGKQLEAETRIPLETSATRCVSGLSREITHFLLFFPHLSICLLYSVRQTDILLSGNTWIIGWVSIYFFFPFRLYVHPNWPKVNRNTMKVVTCEFVWFETKRQVQLNPLAVFLVSPNFFPQH